MSSLQAKRVLVTRPQTPGRDDLSIALRQLGAEPVVLPTVEIQAPDSWEEVDRAIAHLADLDWIVFASANAVRMFIGRCRELTDAIATTRAAVGVAVVGPATAAALEEDHIRVDQIPEVHRAEEIVPLLGDLKEKKVLLPRSTIGGPELPGLLRHAGAEVTEVITYRTVTATQRPEDVERALGAGLDYVTFASGSAVRGLAQLSAAAGLDLVSLLTDAVIACIGPSAARAARELGFENVIVATEHTVDGLISALR